MHGKGVFALASVVAVKAAQAYVRIGNGVKYGVNVDKVLNIARIPEHKVRKCFTVVWLKTFSG